MSATDELRRLKILRKHALITVNAAQETLAQIDAEIDRVLGKVLEEPETSAPRSTNASQYQRLCYWAIHHAGGHYPAGNQVTWEQFSPYLDGARLPSGAALPERSVMEGRLQSKVGTHLVGDAAAGWRLTDTGDKSRRKQNDTTRQAQVG